MLKSSHNPFIYGFFRLYTQIKLKKSFHRVIVSGKTDFKKQSILLIANHISWWDGFWALHLSTKYFNKNYHFMMLEKELRKRWLFSLSGGFSIAHQSKSIIESLNYAGELLKSTKNLVLMFPQGKMHSVYSDEIQFEKGIEYIIKKSGNHLKVVYLVSLIEYFDHQKPDLYLHISESNTKSFDYKNLESDYNSFLNSCICQHKKMYL